MRAWLLSFVLSATLSGCASLKYSGPFLSPPSGPLGSATYALSVDVAGRQWQGISHFENNEKTSIAVLTLEGQKLFSLTWDGKDMHTWKSPLVPDGLPLTLVLRDMQYALWPSQALAHMPGGRRMREKKQERRFSRGRKKILKIKILNKAKNMPFKNSYEIRHLNSSLKVKMVPTQK